MKKHIDEIKKEIENLKKKHNVLVVEGKKDRNALIKLGFRGNEVFPINRTGTSLFVVIDNLINSIGKNKVCILTDIDRKGKILYYQIKRRLDESGIKTDGRLRHLLIKEKISHIEGLDTYLEHGNQED